MLDLLAFEKAQSAFLHSTAQRVVEEQLMSEADLKRMVKEILEVGKLLLLAEEVRASKVTEKKNHDTCSARQPRDEKKSR
jgi:hypothetical protein